MQKCQILQQSMPALKYSRTQEGLQRDKLRAHTTRRANKRKITESDTRFVDASFLFVGYQGLDGRSQPITPTICFLTGEYFCNHKGPFYISKSRIIGLGPCRSSSERTNRRARIHQRRPPAGILLEDSFSYSRQSWANIGGGRLNWCSWQAILHCFARLSCHPQGLDTKAD